MLYSGPMRTLLFAYAWLLLATGIILTSVAVVSARHLLPKPTASPEPTSEPAATSSAQVSPEPLDEGEVQGVSTVAETADARVTIVANFLKRYQSPLKPYDHFGQVFVDLADENGFDFRLLPAIAMQESNLCKSIPKGSFNCLGFGIHERGTLTFDNFEANFERAAKELKQYYIDEGRTTPETIMEKYTPGSNGSWAESVNQWMAEMRYDDRSRGKQSEATENVLEFAKTPAPASPDTSPSP